MIDSSAAAGTAAFFAAALTLAGFWYWALFGLSEDVGLAIGVTVFIAVMFAFAAAAARDLG